MSDRSQQTAVFTVCHATGAKPAKARALLEELAASYSDIDAAARLSELDGRCIYVIVWAWSADSLPHLRACLTELDPHWSKVAYIVGDPDLKAAP
jgi:hypothetical protein